jgi:hypothetical protein
MNLLLISFLGFLKRKKFDIQKYQDREIRCRILRTLDKMKAIARLSSP